MPKAQVLGWVHTPSMSLPICSDQHSIFNRRILPGHKSADEYKLLPDIGNTNVQAPALETVKQSWRDGHHFGILCCMVSAVVVLLINVVLCLVAISKYEVNAGLAILFEGDCDKVKRLNLWLHLLINILSTMLLGASNYTIQCVSAPTRSDIDRAHRENLWMDIGVPSIRNLRFISWPRKSLWCCLVLSSVPLHLMYNSAIYSSTSLSLPTLFVVTDDFLTGASYGLAGLELVNSLPVSFNDPGFNETAMTNSLNQLRNSTSLIRLEFPECQKAYGNTPLISTWSDALAVATTTSTNDSLLGVLTADFCAGVHQINCKGTTMEFDSFLGDKEPAWSVSYCLGTKAHQHCKEGFTVGLMIGVIACNFIKVICMGCIVFRLDPRPLVTLGDALASFLDSPGQYPWFHQIRLHTSDLFGRVRALVLCLGYLGHSNSFYNG